MNKQTIILLASCFFFATALVISLYAVSDKIVHEPGSFLRIYPKGTAIRSNEMNIEFNSWYIAGITEDNIYLGNITAPLQLLITNHTLTDSQHVQIKLKDMEGKPIYKTAKVKIRSPWFYFNDGTTPGLFRGRLGEWQAERFMFDSVYFDQSEMIGPITVAIRARNKNRELILGTVKNSSPHVTTTKDLLQNQIDGIFCTDGMLRYNKDINRLIYTYYYRNEFIVYDTDLNLDYRGHTIDTFSIARIKAAHIKSNDNYVLTSKVVTNQETWTSGNYLFVHSNVMAKNDFTDFFPKMTVIDVYDLTANRYKLSFGLPYEGEEKGIRDFAVFGNRFLITLSGTYIIRYDLQKKYF